jgi:hypothetical protein
VGADLVAEADLRRGGAALAALLAIATCGGAARAQQPASDEDVRRARQLFVDATKDEQALRWDDALEKLREVSHVRFTAGVRFHMALCEEHLGRLTTALDGYKVAEAQARTEQAQDVLKLVGKRIADITPRVPHVTLRVTPPEPDVVVTIDGTRVPAASLGAPLAVDPGEHRIEASTPSRPAKTASLRVLEREHSTFEVKLNDPVAPAPAAAGAGSTGTTTATAPPGVSPTEPVAPPGGAAAPGAPAGASPGGAPPPPPEQPDGSPSRLGAILASAGTLTLAGGGAAAFVLAGNAHSDAIAQCAKVVSTAADACDSQKTTVRAWDATAVSAWIAAGALGAVSIVLWLTPSKPSSTQAASHVWIGPASAGVGGTF